MTTIKKKEILIIYNSVTYFENIIKEKGYHLDYLYKNYKLTTRLIKKICNKLKINDFFLFGDWIKTINTYKIIIVFAPVEDKVLEYIKKKNPSIRIIYWFWNPAYRIGRPTPLHYQVSELWSFDKENTEQYNMNFNNTFYFDSIKSTSDNEQNLYDIVFVGRNKHRSEKLLETKKQLDSLKLNSLFHIVPNRNEDNSNNIKELSYQDYINLVATSKAILDIMPPAQAGLTLRPMESIFLNKKIITDNIHIKKELFYSSKNIFILGEDNINQLSNFLSTPFEPINPEISGYYEFDNWISRIINHKKEDN